MPVIIRGSFANGNGINLDDCTKISVASTLDGNEIKWTDPQDIVFNDKTTAQWIGTKLVRKTGGYPTSETDGTVLIDSKVRNAYSSSAFKDTTCVELEEDIVYYCLFPYTKKAVTKSDNNRFTGEILHLGYVDHVLKNNTWERIAEVSEMGAASKVWKIGDEIDIELDWSLSGFHSYKETVTLQIYDFNHFDKSDGSGKAGICFGTKNLLKTQELFVHTEDGSWSRTYAKGAVMPKIYESFPVNVKAKIKEVNTYAKGAPSKNGEGILSKDYVFPPGLSECIRTNNAQYETKQFLFPIFTDNNSRIKKLSNGTGSIYLWGTRSGCGYLSNYSCYGMWNIEMNGSQGGGMGDEARPGICFCFNI